MRQSGLEPYERFSSWGDATSGASLLPLPPEATLTGGILLGVVTWLSLLLTWHNLPVSVKRWTLKHPLIAEGAATLLTIYTITTVSKTIIAMVAAAVTGLLVNLTFIFFAKTGKKE